MTNMSSTCSENPAIPWSLITGRAGVILKKGVNTLIAVARLLLEHNSAETVFRHMEPAELREAIDNCSDFLRLENQGT